MNIKWMNYAGRLGIVLALLLLSSFTVVAQTGFEDAAGRSAIMLRRGGQAKFNVTDTRLVIGYAHAPRALVPRWGVEVFGKPSEGLASVFQDGEFAPEAGARFTWGKQYLLAPDPVQGATSWWERQITDDWAGLELGYGRSSYFMINDLTAPQPIDTVGGDRFSVRAFYNALPRLYNGLFGIAVGLERSGNYDLLTKVKFQQEVTVLSGDTSRVIATEVTGRTGELVQNWAPVVAADAIWLPTRLGGQIGFNGFFRYDAHEFLGDNFTQGFGVVITAEGSPSKVLGAMSLEWVDGDPRLALVAGFSFGTRDKP